MKPGTILDATGKPIASRRRVAASYDATTWNPDRRMPVQALKPVAQELTPQVRRSLGAQSLYYYQNEPFVRALVERLCTYCVGTGIRMLSASQDDAFRTWANGVFAAWCNYPDLSSRATFGQLQAQILRGAILFGDCGISLTRSQSGRPRVQVVESTRIGNQQSDGVLADDFGRPTAYEVYEDGEKKPTTVDAETFVLTYKPTRPGMRRGEPLLSAALITFGQLHDIVETEMWAVREQQQRTEVVKTATGEVDGSLEDALSGGSLVSATASQDEKRDYYRSVKPGAVVLQQGDSLEMVEPTRPGSPFQGFVEFLSHVGIIGAAGMSPSLLLGTKIGGADTRRELASSQREFEIWQAEIIRASGQIFEHVLQAEIAASSTWRNRAPSDWRAFSGIPPKSITVDYGRDIRADLDSLAGGGMTLTEHAGQYNDDPESYIRQRIADMKLVSRLAEEAGVDAAAVMPILYRDTNKQGAQNAQA